SGGTALPVQAVPHLSCTRRSWRAARSAARCGGRPAQPGPAHPAGGPGRRQHARLREEPEPCGDHCAGGVHGDAPAARAGAGAGRFAVRRLRRGALSAVLALAEGGMLVLSAALAILGAAYLWSWRRSGVSLPVARLWAFLAGLGTIWLAVGPVLGHL